jgi:hypothetical protein
VDLDHVAGQIENMANRDLRELSSRLRRILEHDLKLELLPGYVRAANERGWRGSTSTQQSELETLLEQSPRLGPRIPDLIAAATS